MDDFPSNLAQFTGTEQYHFNPLYRWLRYTDGVKYFCQHAGGGAYWFLDIMGTEMRKLSDAEPFVISIKLSVKEDNACKITADDGDGKILWFRNISYTDCPAGEYRFFLCNQVLMLASEY